MRNLRLLLLIALILLSQIPAYADGDSSSDSDALVVSNYIAWWAHDDLGYHPAVAFLYQNETGDEIPDQIRFQARFMDIRNNYLSVTRSDIRPLLQKGAQRHDTLVGNESYELSIDTKSWPQIECKILYKIGDESEAHQLLIARVEQITMTGEEAVQRLLSAPSRRVKSKTVKHKRKTDQVGDTSTVNQDQTAPPASQEVPLSAGSALSLTAKGNSNSSTKNKDAKDNKDTKDREAKKVTVDRKIESGWHFKNAAGVSDDFFDFEQAYGRPVTYEAAPNKWTWVKYQAQSDIEIYAGAKPGSSKADIVIAFVKSKKPLPEGQLIALGKEFISKYKSQLLGAPVRTVRYLPGGRVQQTSLSASSFHFNIYSTNDPTDDNRYYVALSRVPGSSDLILLEQAKKSKLLRFLLPVMGDAVDQQ
jgi:hypothetical protein